MARHRHVEGTEEEETQEQETAEETAEETEEEAEEEAEEKTKEPTPREKLTMFFQQYRSSGGASAASKEALFNLLELLILDR